MGGLLGWAGQLLRQGVAGLRYLLVVWHGGKQAQ